MAWTPSPLNTFQNVFKYSKMCWYILGSNETEKRVNMCFLSDFLSETGTAEYTMVNTLDLYIHHQLQLVLGP